MILIRNMLITSLLVVTVLLLIGCGSDSDDADIKDVNLVFGGIVATNQDGSVSIIEGNEATAVASVVYSGEGSIKGEWIVDGETTKITADLPVQGEISEDDSEYATLPIECQLPVGTVGTHTISFTLTSPEKIEANTIEYKVEDAPPPANADEYSVSMRIGKGYCITSAEPAIKGKDELALAISIANIQDQKDTRVLLEGDAGKIYPEEGKIPVDEGTAFDFMASVGGPWSLNAGEKVNIKAYLYELDGSGFVNAVLSYVGFTVPGSDDYIGSVSQDIFLDTVAATSANPNGTNHTTPVSFTGASTESGEKVFLMDFSNGRVGHYLLELIVKVESR